MGHFFNIPIVFSNMFEAKTQVYSTCSLNPIEDEALFVAAFGQCAPSDVFFVFFPVSFCFAGHNVCCFLGCESQLIAYLFVGCLLLLFACCLLSVVWLFFFFVVWLCREAVVCAALRRHWDSVSLVPPPESLEGVQAAEGLSSWVVPNPEQPGEFFEATEFGWQVVVDLFC